MTTLGAALDPTDRLLEAIQALQLEVQATRQEGNDRNTTNRAVSAELHAAIVHMGKTLDRHTADIALHGGKLAALADAVEAHTRMIDKLIEQDMGHSKMLLDHAKLIGELKDAISAAKEWARDAQQAVSDLKSSNADFQKAITNHVTTATKALREDTQTLKDNDLSQAVEMHEIKSVQSVMVTAFGLEEAAEAAKSGKPLDKLPPSTLDKLRGKNQGTLVASVLGVLLLVLKITWEILQQSHVAPPTPTAPAPQQPAQPLDGGQGRP